MTLQKSLYFSLFFSLLAATAQAGDLQRGIDLYNGKKYQDAEQELRKAVDADADNAKAQTFLGLSLMHQGKIGESEAPLRKADQLNPDSADVKLGLARVALEHKNTSEADALIKRAEQIDKNSQDMPFLRGLLKATNRQYADAAKDLEEAIRRNPENAYAHYYAGLAYNGLRRPDKMVAHFEQFLKLAPEAPERSRVQSILSTVR